MWKANQERGTSLVETLMAVFIAVISMTSLGAVIFLSTVQNKNEGFETTRMTVFAREKIEELIYLDYSDTSSNISSVTDAAWDVGLTAGGPTDLGTEITACPTSGNAVGYVDFLDSDGIKLSGTACSDAALSTWAYIRQWKIEDDPGGTPDMKQISVAVHAPAAVRTGGNPPIVMLTTYKSEL